MPIIGVPDSLRCKLLYETFRDTAMCWYIDLPRASITRYQDLVKKLVHQIVATLLKRMFSTYLFNIRHGSTKSQMGYLIQFIEATTRDVHPN